MRQKIYILIMLLAMITPLAALSQRGEKTMSVLGGYNTETKAGLAGIAFQYRFSKHFRLSPDFQILFKHKGLSAFQFNGNAHFPIGLSKKMNCYPLLGITYQSWKDALLIDSETYKYFGANFGAGLELMATSTLKLSLEGKYSWVKSFPSATFTFGIGYLF